MTESPATQQVRAALATGPSTMARLVEETGLARRTIYTIMQHFRSLGQLKEQVSLTDARQTWFWLQG